MDIYISFGYVRAHICLNCVHFVCRSTVNPPQTQIRYAHENKCEKLLAERGKFHYTRSAEHAVLACEKYHYCLQSQRRFSFCLCICIINLFFCCSNLHTLQCKYSAEMPFPLSSSIEDSPKAPLSRIVSLAMDESLPYAVFICSRNNTHSYFRNIIPSHIC
jgi:hypothetical protein